MFTLHETGCVHDSMNVFMFSLHKNRCVRDSMNRPKMNLLLILTYYIISQVSIFNFHVTWLVFWIF